MISDGRTRGLHAAGFPAGCALTWVRGQVATAPAPAASNRACGSPAHGSPTKITHVDQGLDFLGWRIQRHRKRGTNRYYVYTYPSRKAIKAVTVKVKTICRRNVSQPLQTLIRQLNPALRGWCAYFKPGVSAATFADLANHTLDRILRWARRKHRRITVKTIRRRYCNGGWWPTTPEIGLFNPTQHAHHALPLPGNSHPHSVDSHGMNHHDNP